MTSSDSWVVNPAPENADSDWNDAISFESPVIVRTTVSILTINRDSEMR